MTTDFSLKINQFFSHFALLKYKKNEVVLRPDDHPQGVLYMKKGFIRMYSVSEGGKELTLNIFKPGSYFPMTWALGNEQNTYFYETMTDVEIWRAPKDEVINYIKKEPEILFELTRRILVGLSGTLVRMEYLLFGSAYNKVAATLLLSARRFGIEEKLGRIIIELPLTHQHIAYLSGLTRETTSLELKKLEKKGIITHKNRYLVVKNIKKLREESLMYIDETPLPYAF